MTIQEMFPVEVELTFKTVVEGGGTQNDAYMDAISELKRQLEAADSTDDVIMVFNKYEITPCS